jgi:outer membrane protein assembly factor BamD
VIRIAFRRRTIRLAALALAVALAGCAATVEPPLVGSGDSLDHARRLMDRRDYLGASEWLTGYVNSHAGSADVDEAIYLLGDCRLRGKEYAMAQVEFERLLRDYPESDSNAAGSFRLGEAMQKQSRMEDFDQEFTVRALEQYQRYLREYPGHWLNPEAEKRVAELRSQLAKKLIDTGDLYLKLSYVRAARVYYERVWTDYADTPRVGEAEIGLARCDALLGKRDEAIAALKEMESRFAGQTLAMKAAEARRIIEREARLHRARKPVRNVPDSPQ